MRAQVVGAVLERPMAAIDWSTPTSRQTRYSPAPFLIRPCGLPSIRNPPDARRLRNSTSCLAGKPYCRSRLRRDRAGWAPAQSTLDFHPWESPRAETFNRRL